MCIESLHTKYERLRPPNTSLRSHTLRGGVLEDPPEKIFSIFEHKKDIAEQVIREKGFKLKKECHGGARKRTKTQILAKRAPGCTVPAVDSDFE